MDPPIPISPLPVTGLNPNVESIGTIELVINEEGNGDRVRLISQPTRMQPLMLLSAAKAAAFRPALRDGRPVKFRLCASKCRHRLPDDRRPTLVSSGWFRFALTAELFACHCSYVIVQVNANGSTHVPDA